MTLSGSLECFPEHFKQLFAVLRFFGLVEFAVIKFLQIYPNNILILLDIFVVFRKMTKNVKITSSQEIPGV